MRISFLLLCLTFYYHISAAQELSIDAKRINYAYIELQKEPRAAISQVNFIAAFPPTKKQFLDVFYPVAKDQLFDTRMQYIETMQTLAVLYPKDVLLRILKIGINMNASGDIVKGIQALTLELANKKPDVFIEEVKRLKKKEIYSLAKFLSSADTGAYQTLIDNLQNDKTDKLAAQFISAREERKKQVHE